MRAFRATPQAPSLSRRGLMDLVGLGALAGAGALAGCAGTQAAAVGDAAAKLDPLPPASPNPEDPFGVDCTITMDTIDDWLNRPDVVYRDLRLLRDPASYEEIGGSATLDFMLEGFTMIPYPYIGTLQQLPVAGAYTGPTLFDVVWNADGTIASATANYEQSRRIVEELFPPHKPLFLMCGGAGYAHMMQTLLIYLGWDPQLVYNVGGAWSYTGYHLIELTHHNADGSLSFFTWRAPTVPIEFAAYTPVA